MLDSEGAFLLEVQASAAARGSRLLRASVSVNSAAWCRLTPRGSWWPRSAEHSQEDREIGSRASFCLFEPRGAARRLRSFRALSCGSNPKIRARTTPDLPISL